MLFAEENLDLEDIEEIDVLGNSTSEFSIEDLPSMIKEAIAENFDYDI
jgi:hypothetical protein